jgi:high-affinity Fe2+/Pb2+ permease
VNLLDSILYIVVVTVVMVIVVVVVAAAMLCFYIKLPSRKFFSFTASSFGEMLISLSHNNSNT